jgi:hypothetical protein
VKQEQELVDHQYLLLDLTFILKRRHLLLLAYLLDHHLVRLDQMQRVKLRRRWVLLIKLVSHFMMDGADDR